MGQYHQVVNLDKKQYLHPHKFGDGLKMMEFGSSGQGTMMGLTVLIACSHNRGGGDIRSDDPLLGSWSGDRIAIIGDYSEENDIVGIDASTIYDDESYEDISDQVVKLLVDAEMMITPTRFL